MPLFTYFYLFVQTKLKEDITWGRDKQSREDRSVVTFSLTVQDLDHARPRNW